MPLQRILEPEVMGSCEEATDYDTMDHSQVNRQFVADLLAAGPAAGLCADLGTGTALIPVALCEAAPQCRVAAMDASTEMLDLARYRVEVAGLTERIQLVHADAKQTGWESAGFDLVISNSIVHHIPEPRLVLREAVRLLREDGWLFFRDLLRPADLATLQQLVQTYAGQENAHQRQMLSDSLHAALTLEEMRLLVQQLGGSPRQVQATSDRHWTWIARRAELD